MTWNTQQSLNPLLTHNFDFTVASLHLPLSLFFRRLKSNISFGVLSCSPPPFALPLRYSIVAAAAAAAPAREVTLTGCRTRSIIYFPQIYVSERLTHPVRRMEKSSHTRALLMSSRKRKIYSQLLKFTGNLHLPQSY